MQLTLWVTAEFSAAHDLSQVFQASHKCSRMHGHNYTVRLSVVVPEKLYDPEQPVVVDFFTLQTRLHQAAQLLDHRSLNDVLTTPPTVENICRWFMNQLDDLGARAIRVEEQPGMGCELRTTSAEDAMSSAWRAAHD